MIKFSANDISFIDSSWDALVTLLKELPGREIAILVDSNTKVHCLPHLSEVLEKANIVYTTLEVEAGEDSKDLNTCTSLWAAMTEDHVVRKSILLNLGGGMVCDLGGFTASVYKRGIDFINIPTSLLGMVDAAIGGKCGIDFNGYKNQLGAFQVARKTFIHPTFLKSLPPSELKSGVAEMLKHALIADSNHWERLTQTDLTKRPSLELIQQSIAVKSKIVAEDPLEKGIRKKLNFGHTVGHAIESFFLESGNPIPHGFAVVAGMIVETKISSDLGLLSKEDSQEIVNQLDLSYQRLLIKETDFSHLLSFMRQDKKNEGTQINFTLLTSIGESVYNQLVAEDAIQKALNFYVQL